MMHPKWETVKWVTEKLFQPYIMTTFYMSIGPKDLMSTLQASLTGVSQQASVPFCTQENQVRDSNYPKPIMVTKSNKSWKNSIPVIFMKSLFRELVCSDWRPLRQRRCSLAGRQQCQELQSNHNSTPNSLFALGQIWLITSVIQIPTYLKRAVEKID